MPPKALSFPGGIVRLNKLLSNLNAPPRLVLSGVKSLRVSLSAKGDHFGAQHFVKDHLPRIRYANPNLDIQVVKVPKSPQEKWRPEMEIELENGKVKKLDMNEKWSTSITKELMELTGGEEWQKHVFSCKNAGLPILPGAELYEQEERKAKEKTTSGKKLPSLAEYLEAHPAAKKALAARQPIKQKEKKEKEHDKTTPPLPASDSDSPSPISS